MPPKVTDTHPIAEQQNFVEEETALAARRIIATYAHDFMDGVTLMSMLGVEPEGLIHKKVLAEQEDQSAEPADKPAAKKTAKKAAKKSTKKTTKKTAKKTAKKSTKKTTKKTAKKTAKKAAKKTAKKA